MVNTDGDGRRQGALRKLPGVKGVSSMAGSIVNSVKTGKGNFEAVVDYTDPDYEYSTNPTMLYGHWFTWDDYDSGLDVAVLSEKDAIRMFGTADVVGLTFEMDDGSSIKDVRIVGVKKALDGTFVNEGYGDYLGITVPLTSVPTGQKIRILIRYIYSRRIHLRRLSLQKRVSIC